MATGLICSLAVVFTAGCGTLPNARGWGQDVAWPSWSRFQHAVVNAATDTNTWAPILGAYVAGRTNLDEEISEGLAGNAPVYGSRQNASKMSDSLRRATFVLGTATLLATPSGDESGDWARAKLNGLFVESSANVFTGKVVSILKEESFDNIRPDRSNDEDFPSSHASSAFTAATLGSRNVRSMQVSDSTKAALNTGLYTLAAGTAWARVEANRHHPSSVLTGAALGHFFSAVIYDTFMGLDSSAMLTVGTSGNGPIVQFGWIF